jgi:iron complex outermembrane receptor protein
MTNWQLQSGVRFIGERFLDNANTTTTPSVTLVDASVRRRLTQRISADLRVSNLFDEFYLQGATGVPVAVRGRYGAPRTVELTFDLGF